MKVSLSTFGAASGALTLLKQFVLAVAETTEQDQLTLELR